MPPDHTDEPDCECNLCTHFGLLDCENTLECIEMAKDLIQSIRTKWNPDSPEQNDGLELTEVQRKENESALRENKEIIFDPDVTVTKERDAYRVFTNPEMRLSFTAYRQRNPRGVSTATYLTVRGAEVVIDKAEMKAGGSAWYGKDDARNIKTKPQNGNETAQAGEAAALYKAVKVAPLNKELHINCATTRIVEALTTKLKEHEARDWMGCQDRADERVFRRGPEGYRERGLGGAVLRMRNPDRGRGIW
jgi:hypothetical protein